MHLQQTKVGSRRSGGPQSFFHDVPDVIKDHLRRRGQCKVVLQTPYGIAQSPFMAIGCDHKLDARGRLIRGRVGHDRIQQAGGASSIGEAIRQWYCLPSGDFERVDLDVVLHPEGHFIVSPLRCYLRGRTRCVDIPRPHRALSFTRAYQSPLWRRQLQEIGRHRGEELAWIEAQVRRVVASQSVTTPAAPKEEDLLRAAGALSKLGMNLSAYVGRGYDCPASTFRMLDYPEYPCPVEVKKRSHGFKYQMLQYAPLPRAVILCVEHDLANPPDHVDVVELAALADEMQEIAHAT